MKPPRKLTDEHYQFLDECMADDDELTATKLQSILCACLDLNRGHTRKSIRGKSAVRMQEAAGRLPHFRVQLTHDLRPRRRQTAACVYLSADLYCTTPHTHIYTHHLPHTHTPLTTHTRNLPHTYTHIPHGHTKQSSLKLHQKISISTFKCVLNHI